MGEITEALRRARAERGAQREADERKPAERKPDPPPRAPEPTGTVLAPVAAAPASRHAEISRERAGFWQARALLMPDQRAVAERFRHLAVRISRELVARGSSTLLVTSSAREEGKSVVSCNLALALASMSSGERVALVDLDLRGPSVARGLGIPVETGFEAVLRGECGLDAVRVGTDIPTLDVFPSEHVADAHELLSLPALGQALSELRRDYRVVVIDCPPVLLFPDVPLVSSTIGSCLLVARAGQSRRRELMETLGMLSREDIVGVFLNEGYSGAEVGGYYAYERKAREDADADAEEES
jgi:Mrp family chromosome partitioning ATPase